MSEDYEKKRADSIKNAKEQERLALEEPDVPGEDVPNADGDPLRPVVEMPKGTQQPDQYITSFPNERGIRKG
jgi:hypothetical protein